MVQSAEILISGFLANPAGTDSPYEYVQLLATQSIDFATTNYSVVWNNNGTALANGWITGGSLSYGFNLNSGSVAAGEVFYVGGSGKLINGVGSTDLSSQKWIRTIPTGTTAGDSFGSLNTGGVLGNGGGNADGIAIFSFSTSSLTSTTVPVDAVFFGTGVGTAKPATGGYVVPDNDFYDGGVFGGTGSTALLPDAGSAEFIKLTGTYDPSLNLWSVPRSGSTVALTTTSAASAIASSLTLIPEPSVSAMGLLALTLLGRRKRA
jgi:hypothetical protein